MWWSVVVKFKCAWIIKKSYILGWDLKFGMLNEKCTMRQTCLAYTVY